jgi:hypothetical protein
LRTSLAFIFTHDSHSCILKIGCFIFKSVFTAPTGRRFIIKKIKCEALGWSSKIFLWYGAVEVYVSLILENYKLDFFSMKPRLFDGWGHVLSIAYESKQTTRLTWRCVSRKSKTECKNIVYESALWEFTLHKLQNCLKGYVV